MNNKLKAMAAGLIVLPISLNSFAADAALTGAFKTIKDVTITQVAGHEMVINGLQMSATNSCTVTTPTTGANWPGDTVMLASTGGTALPSSNYGATSGAGCSTGTSVPGIFEIDGAAGASVDIAVQNNASAGGITFVPAGCAIDYDGNADGDLCTALTAGAATITLAAVGDQTVSAGNGQPVAGKSRLVLAGTVTTAIGLSAATAYVVPFDITVTY